jgi:hypothetical protein
MHAAVPRGLENTLGDLRDPTLYCNDFGIGEAVKTTRVGDGGRPR